MTNAEAAALDPQLRMLLEVTYECLENAGTPIQTAAGSNTSSLWIIVFRYAYWSVRFRPLMARW